MTKFNGLQLTQISFDLEDIKSYLVAADEVEGEERVERGRREEAVAAVTLEVGFKNISQLTRRYSYDVNKISTATAIQSVAMFCYDCWLKF